MQSLREAGGRPDEVGAYVWLGAYGPRRVMHRYGEGEKLEAAMRVTVFIWEDERHGARPLFEVLFLAARERGLNVAAVLKTTVNSGISTARSLRLARNPPFLSQAVKAGVITCPEVDLYSPD